jgi:uncharacterized coiled-coil protein SlyX
MTDETANLILEHLRAIRTDISGLSRRIDTLTLRVNAVEIAIAGLGKEVAVQRADIAHQWTVLDQYDKRIKHLEVQSGLIQE